MSYDVDLLIDTGGPEKVSLFDWNYTGNCSPMWRAAGADLAEYHEKTAAECIPSLANALDVLRLEPALFIAMNPENGWGSYDTLLPALEKLLAAFRAHPLATVWVSR